jgi:uncharacterized protein (DUF2249 family)
MTIDLLDVRPLEPRVRHRTIFERLDALPCGSILRLVVDHEPRPLRFQLEAERPEHFGWHELEAGPDRWTVDIRARARVVDARPILASGGEPFGMIMDAAAKTSTGEVLVVYAPFEPVPLEGVLGEDGFEYRAEQLEGTDWRVVFCRSAR